MKSTDQEINRGVRSVLSRHWVDLTKTNFLTRQGVLRMMGELRRIGAEASTPMKPRILETLDKELKRVHGVRRVQYDLSNWRRNEDGEWRPIARPSHRSRSSELEEEARAEGEDEGEGEETEPDPESDVEPES